MHNILFPPKFVLLILYFLHQFCKYKTAIGCNEGVDRVNGKVSTDGSDIGDENILCIGGPW